MHHHLQQFISSYFPSQANAVLINSRFSREYLLNFKSTAGSLLIFPEKQYFIVDFRYIEKARQQISTCEVILQESLPRQIAALLNKHGAKTCAVEEKMVTISDYFKLCDDLVPVTVLQQGGVSALLESMRMIKTQHEIEKLRRAQEITDQTFQQLAPTICPGMTERHIATEIEYRLKKNGAHGISFETIVAAGENSSLPHGRPTDYAVQNGDFITMDFGAVFEGYHADMTRTLSLGSVSDQQRSVYQTVLEAQQRVLNRVKAGMVCAEVDQIAREYIDSAGYEGCFGHGLGHGVGLEIHEHPNFSPHNKTVLQEGMILTVEPGIYLPGRFGVRIEDIIVIRSQGCDNITTSTKDLIQL